MRIEQLIPRAGTVDEVGLRGLDPDELARFVLDPRRPWWRRQPCVAALEGRLPAAHVPALLDRIRDPADATPVRIALLDLLQDRGELLPWLCEQSGELPYGLREAILKARAALGDLSVVPEVVVLADDRWQHRKQIGEAALGMLVARHGVAAVERELGDSPADRACRVRMASRAGGDVTGAFTDPEFGVARTACELVIASGIPEDEMLLDHAITGPTEDARVWALYALAGRGRDVAALWDAIDRPRVEVPGLPEDVRLAIVREYDCQHDSDPRWLVERACIELPDAPDESAQLARASTALAAAGLSPGAPRSAGEVWEQGSGTYHEIEVGDGVVMISTLGPYATGSQIARAALEAAGFRWIDDALGGICVTGFCVYYFGRRAPLDVKTLLFYWQD